MPTPKIVEIPEDENVVCPVCNALIVDDDDVLVSQPSCDHVLFVFANAEAFEYDTEKFEERLDAAQEKADEEGAYFDPWDWLSAQCEEGDVILEQNSGKMACGPVSFKVWVGVRGERKDSRLRLVRNEKFSSRDTRIFFRPTNQFVQWMKARHGKQQIYDVGCGVGGTSKALAEAGLQVTGIDLEPRTHSEFPVIQADSTEYRFEKGSVVMFCRPCHEGFFVRETILRALNCGVRAIVYVGLDRNVRYDLGGYYSDFTKHRIQNIGHADERIWEMKFSRLQANANLRRG